MTAVTERDITIESFIEAGDTLAREVRGHRPKQWQPWRCHEYAV
jgi:hypothetical protein